MKAPQKYMVPHPMLGRRDTSIVCDHRNRNLHRTMCGEVSGGERKNDG